MENIFIIAAFIALLFLVAKFIEMRFVDKENKPVKFLIRDALLVYVSVVSGHYIFEQFKPMTEMTSEIKAFTDTPGF
jgi:hypothetical protein